MKKLSEQPAEEVARVFQAVGFEPIFEPVEITSREQLDGIKRENERVLKEMRDMGYEP